MDLLTDADLATIETQIFGAMIERYGLDLAGLALGMTNFATYIDSTNERAPIAQRGKAKQKRVDLRLVGLVAIACIPATRSAMNCRPGGTAGHAASPAS